MLLWLTLTLLWSPTCWAGQMYGPGGGWHFSTFKDYENEITGIRVFVGAIGIFKSIQVRFGSPGVKNMEFQVRSPRNASCCQVNTL